MGRAHRIGQTRPVAVYRLVTKGSVEEQIVELHHDKRALAESILAEGDAALLPSDGRPGRADPRELRLRMVERILARLDVAKAPEQMDLPVITEGAKVISLGCESSWSKITAVGIQ